MVNAANNGNSATATANGTIITTGSLQPTIASNGGMIQTHVFAGQTLTTMSPAAQTSRVLMPHELGTITMPQLQQFQFQPLQTHQQPQYIIYNNSNDVTMLRQITTANTPISNAIFHQTTHQQHSQPQQAQQIVSNPSSLQQTTFVTHKNLPKSSLGATHYSNSGATAVTAVPISFSSNQSSIFVDGNGAHHGSGPIIMATNKSASLIQSAASTQFKAASNEFVQGIVGNTVTTASLSAVMASANSAEISRQNGSSVTTDNNRPTTTQANDINKYVASSSGAIAARPIDNHVVSTLNVTPNPTNVTNPVTAETRTIDSADASQHEAIVKPEPENEAEPEPEIDIVINNVVCSFSVRCHLNLREIALNGRNVEFRRENGMVTMKLRHPYTTASIWSSGRITCTGATSEDQVSLPAVSFPPRNHIPSHSNRRKSALDATRVHCRRSASRCASTTSAWSMF